MSDAHAAVAKYLHDIDCRSAIHSGHPADFECYNWAEEAKELLDIVAPLVLREASDAYPLETAYGGAEHAVLWLKERANELERTTT